MGLTKAEIPGYWAQRGARYASAGNWGLGASTPELHEALVAERAEFIFQDCPRNLRTLDFGCGIGMYSKYFDPDKYLGVDIAEPHLVIARENNQGHKYAKMKRAMFDELEEQCDFPFDIFFTATVLQHCSDATVNCVFSNIAERGHAPFAFSLYEYANPNWTSRQTVGRTPDEYIEMVAQYFRVVERSARTHTIRGPLCAHTMIHVEPNGD
jgi:SAM-dependent methyltransferase